MSEPISSLATALWPLSVLVALVIFRRPLTRLIRAREHRDVTLQVGGQELSVRELTRQQTKLITDLQTQLVILRERLDELLANDSEHRATKAGTGTRSRSPSKAADQQIPAQPRPTRQPIMSVESPVRQRVVVGGSLSTQLPSCPPPWERHQRYPVDSSPSVDPHPLTDSAGSEPEPTMTRPAPTGVLWVDDHPADNAIEMDRLQSHLVRVDTAHSTDEALNKLSSQRYRVIVSDMNRREHNRPVPDAGVRLVRAVRALDPETPIVIFADGEAEQSVRSSALAAGADLVTGSPLRLYEEFRRLQLVS